MRGCPKLAIGISLPMRFAVDLPIFSGPLDLLHYLVRKHELDITEISLSKVTQQYLEHLAALEQVDVNAVGEFLEVASLLIEIKSRMVLPSPEEPEEPVDAPRQELVRRLLEYKEFRDAASILSERGRTWRDRYSRCVEELPGRSLNPANQPIEPVELWDLVSALGRLTREHAAATNPTSIRYDDTPISVFMRQIYDQLSGEQRLAFSKLLPEQSHRSTAVGFFLASLELLRHRWARADQEDLFTEIWLKLGDRQLPKVLEDFDNE